jgi:tRNA-binding protein
MIFRAWKPAYQLTIDFGIEIGILLICTNHQALYKEALLDRQIIAVVNFPKESSEDWWNML